LTLVSEAIFRNFSDEISPARRGGPHLPAFRSAGYVRGSRLTEKAFLEYLDTFEEISVPPRIKALVDSYGMRGIRWRRVVGDVEANLVCGGLALPKLKTVFIRDGAGECTWLEELGHIIYSSLKKEPRARILFRWLAKVARANCEIILSAGETVSDAITGEALTLPRGQYLLVNGRYHGLDCSSGGQDGEADELWASLFSEYYIGNALAPKVRSAIEKVIFFALNRP
jgi:hypothetical protein